MPQFKVVASDFITISKDGKPLKLIRAEKVNAFNASILGLGKIEKTSEQISALSVIFDLEGFTAFCKQIDPHLAVPEYLSEFLNWIFSQVTKELTHGTFEEGIQTYASFPFISKYLGDGVLFLWNTKGMSDTEILNIVVSMREICNNYMRDFLPKVSNKVVSPPTKLRCGIARGIIYSVGDGNDFVGPCINMSARLQKLNTLSFCFSRRGLDPEKMHENVRNRYITKKVDIRGIGSEELVCLLKKEFDNLDPADKSKFKET